MSHTTKRRRSPLEVASILLNEVSTALLVAILALISLDVVTRNLGSTGILGTVEIVMLLLLVAVAGALPQLERTGEFLRVDIFQDRLGPRVRGVVRIVLALVQLFFSALLTWRVTEYALQQMQTGRVTDILRFPIHWPYWIGAGCFAVLTIATAVQIVRLFVQLFRKQTDAGTNPADADGTKGILA